MRDRLLAFVQRHRTWLPLAVPLLVAVAVYARVLGGEFQFDDALIITRNAAVKDLGRFLRGEFLRGFATAGRPVADLTFAIDYAAWGFASWGFHVTNLAIHLAAVILAWVFVRRVLVLANVREASWIALAVAGAFALHPIQTQAVSYVVQRSESLASALYMASLLLVLAAEARGLATPAWRLLGGGWLLLVLALGAKPIAVTMPLAWFLIAALVPSPEARARLADWRRRMLVSVPFVAVSALHAWRTIASTSGAADAGFSVPGITPWSYLLTQLRVITTYVRLLFWPVGQNLDWDFRLSSSLADAAVILSAAFLIALAGVAIWLAVVAGRRLEGDAGAASRVVGFGVLWFFLVLSPTSSIVPISDVIMEHRVYLASLGVFLAIAVAVERLVATRIPEPRTKAVAASLAVVLAALSVAAFARNGAWVSSEALWADAARKSPLKARPLMNLGYVLATKGRAAEGLRLHEAALALVPADDRAQRLPVLANMGAIQLASGRIYDARATLRRALELGGTSSGLWVTMSAVHLSLMELDEARRAARAAIDIDANDAEAWSMASIVAYRRGEKAEALDAAQRAMRLDPDLVAAQFSVGQALHGLGRDAEACVAWARIGPSTDPSLSFLRSQAKCSAR